MRIISSSDLGNCWSPELFCSGGRCYKVMACKLPEKQTCEAVKSEITYLKNRQEKLEAGIKIRVEQLEGALMAEIKLVEDNKLQLMGGKKND